MEMLDWPGDQRTGRGVMTGALAGYVLNHIKMQMMFILGDADYRTPPGSGGEQFFRALKYKKIPTVMVRFPRESHELSRSGEPWHRIERLENITNWFDHYLMGVCEPQYEVVPTCKASNP